MNNSILFTIMNKLVGSGYSRKAAYQEAKNQLNYPVEKIQVVEILHSKKGWDKRVIVGDILHSRKKADLRLMKDLIKILNGDSHWISTYKYRFPQEDGNYISMNQVESVQAA